MRALATLLVILVPLSAFAQKKKEKKEEPAEPRTAISSTMVLKVSDRNKTADALIADAEKLGGYFSSRTDDQVTLKVPTEDAKSFIADAEKMGKVVERSFSANDVGGHLRELRTLLKSRQQVFQRYFAVLSSATQSTIVQVEAQMTQLVQEIEGLKGQIRLIQHQLQFAEIVVRFEFRERRPPSRDGNSSFEWLNTVNIADLFEEFAHAD
jgi:hypothetical protein